MASRESPGREVFGFRFYGSEQQEGEATPSDPPSGPPLLDNIESDILRTFFENPNNLDPSFLNNDYQRMNMGVYGSDNLNWMTNNNNNATFGQAYSQTRQYPVLGGEQERSSFGNFGPGGGQLPASDDVYEAARLLHHNHNGRLNGVASLQNDGLMSSNIQRESDRGGMQYPQPPSLHHMPYDLTSSNAYSIYYGSNQSKNGLHDYAKTSSVRKESNTSSRVDGSGRQRSVTFGSDEKFRQTHYAAPLSGEAPDKTIEHGLIGALRYHPTGLNSMSSSPDQSERKRSSHSHKVDEHEDAEESAEEVTPPPQKRRKRRVEDDDEEFGVKKTKAKSQKTRRSSSPGRSSNIRRTSSVTETNKRSKLSPGDSKANRENLSEEQKRSNHIQSEQKRRNLIKHGFEDLTKMVPELRAGGFSKSAMLVEASKFMKLLRDGNDQLRAQLQNLDAG